MQIPAKTDGNSNSCASQTGGGISEVGFHPDREICPVFRIPRVLVQAAVDQVTALGEERNASRNLPVEIDPQVGGKGHFDTAETLRPGCCIQLVVGPFTGALQPDTRAERNLAAVVVGGKIAIESRGTVMEFGLVVVIDIAVHAQFRPETARGTPRHLAVERQDWRAIDGSMVSPAARISLPCTTSALYQ